MTVYVDEMIAHGQSKTWRHASNCHMIADTHEELEAMARLIGLKREWIQNSGTPHEHYDLVASKRAAAVHRGAMEIDWRDMARLWRVKREPAEEVPA